MFSRLGQSSIFAGGRSLYETLRQQDDDEDSDTADDVEQRAGLRAAHYDEELEGPEDYELRPPADLTNVAYSQTPSRRPFPPSRGASTRASGSSRLNYMSAQLPEEGSEVEEVPVSLLVDRARNHGGYRDDPRDATPGPSADQLSMSRKPGMHTHWGETPHPPRRQERPHTQEEIRRARIGLIDPKSRAMWRWANVENVDNFLHDVYRYYVGNGIYSLLLTRLLNLLTSAFIVTLVTFLGSCIDYSRIKHSTKLSEVTVPHCTTQLSKTTSFLLWMFCIYWIWTLINLLLDLRPLWELHQFFLYLLDIPEGDMQTISWQEIVHRLMGLRDANPTTSNALRRRHRASQSKERMDAHDIANRLMRKENYMIALFNKDILDLTVPLPFLRTRGGILTKALTWNIEICIMDYVFNNRGQLRPVFLKEGERRMLSDGLRRRFIFYGWANLLFAPLILSYLVVFFFLRYYAEFRKDPGQIGHRQYTPLAEWKFREFNELWHLFEQRINMSYPFAERYVDQFPKDKTIQLARFVHFIAGAFAAVLAVAALYDPELITTFEITPGGTIVFYVGILASIIAVARGMIPEEKLVYDPEEAIKYVIDYTHYQPSEWQGKLHSDEVKRDFMKLYDLKIMIFWEELLSVMTTPFVMWFSLYNCSDKIIDFFREFTVHVDGIGYVCSYAVFDFKRNGAMKDTHNDQHVHADNKMISSYWGFLDQYGAHNQGGRRRTAVHPAGLSPGLHADDLRGGAKHRLHSGAGVHHSVYGGPLRPHMPMGASASASILLDPHHQPPPGTFQRRNQPPALHRHPSAASAATEEEIQPNQYISDLGDPFMSARLSATVTTDEDPADAHAAAGVLGLLNQFQMVQNNGGRGGVNI